MTDWILIEKRRRTLTYLRDGRAAFCCRVALGDSPEGKKTREGDGKTPEGEYFVCVKKIGKYGPSLGVSYPSASDAEAGGLPRETVELIAARAARLERPPWGTPLGGEIYIHGGGASSDWTRGCVALDNDDMQTLYDQTAVGTNIRIIK